MGISAIFSRTLELDALLPKIVDSLFQLFKQADRAFIILQGGDPPRLGPALGGVAGVRSMRGQRATRARAEE